MVLSTFQTKILKLSETRIVHTHNQDCTVAAAPTILLTHWKVRSGKVVKDTIYAMIKLRKKARNKVSPVLNSSKTSSNRALSKPATESKLKQSNISRTLSNGNKSNRQAVTELLAKAPFKFGIGLPGAGWSHQEVQDENTMMWTYMSDIDTCRVSQIVTTRVCAIRL